MIGINLPTVLVVRKGRKRKQLQEARETRMTPRDDRNETEIRNISTRVEGMAHGHGDVRDSVMLMCPLPMAMR